MCDCKTSARMRLSSTAISCATRCRLRSSSGRSVRASRLHPTRMSAKPYASEAKPHLALDVLAGEVRPRRGEQENDPHSLYREAPCNVAPQDRVAEEIDKRQPVVSWKIGMQNRGCVQEVEDLEGDQRCECTEGCGKR